MVIPTVGKLSIVSLVIYFCIYLAVHIIIGYFKEQTIKDVIKDPSMVTEKKLKLFSRLFTWWPAVAVILIVLVLYFQ